MGMAGAVTQSATAALNTTTGLSISALGAGNAAGQAGQLSLAGKNGSATSSVTLQALLIDGAGSVTGTSVTINTNNIIGSGLNAFNIITPSTATTSGSVLISASGIAIVKDDVPAVTSGVTPLPITLNAAQPVGAAPLPSEFLNFSTNSPLIVGLAAANGSIVITTSAIPNKTSPGLEIVHAVFALDGDVTLNDTGTNVVAGALPNIVLDQSSAVKAVEQAPFTSLGNVIIAVGSIPSAASLKAVTVSTFLGTSNPVKLSNDGSGGTLFSNLSSRTGIVQSTAPGNGLDIQGSNITLSAPTATAISLQGNVLITADPPPSLSGTSAATAATTPSGNRSGIQIVPTGSASGADSVLTANSSISQSATQSSSGAGLPRPIYGQGLSTTQNSSSSALYPIASTWNYANSQIIATDNTKFSAIGAGQSVSSQLSSSASDCQLSGTATIASQVSNTSNIVNSFSSTADIQNGSVLLNAAHDVVLHFGSAKLRVKAGGLAFIIHNDATTAIYNLHDTHAGSCTVDIAGREIEMHPGTAVIICSSELAAKPGLQFADVNPAASMSYRNVSDRQSADAHVFEAEFSPLQAFTTFEPLQRLLHSKQAGDLALIKRLVKTCAAVMAVKQASQPYQRVLSEPRLTSMAN